MPQLYHALCIALSSGKPSSRNGYTALMLGLVDMYASLSSSARMPMKDLANFMNIQYFPEKRRRGILLLEMSRKKGSDAVIKLKKLLDDETETLNVMREYESDNEAVQRVVNLLTEVLHF